MHDLKNLWRLQRQFVYNTGNKLKYFIYRFNQEQVSWKDITVDFLEIFHEISMKSWVTAKTLRLRLSLKGVNFQIFGIIGV